MIGLAISLLTGGLGRAFKLLRGLDAKTLAIIALALFAALQIWRVGSVTKQREAVTMALRVQTTATRDAAARINAASAKATDAWKRNASRIDALNEINRKEADARLATIRADYRARTNAFVARMRTAQAANGFGNPSQSDLPKDASATSRVDGPDNAAVMVAESDVFTCSEIAARLVTARDWAVNLEGIR